MTISEFFENYESLKKSLRAFNLSCTLQLGDCDQEYEYDIPDEGLFDWLDDDKYKEFDYHPTWSAEARLGHSIDNLTDLQEVLSLAFPHFSKISENHEVYLYTHGIRFKIWYKHISLLIELDVFIDNSIIIVPRS